MSEGQSSMAGWSTPRSLGPPDGLVSKVVYRSRAVRALSAQDLEQLVSAAQERNRREAITGVMLYNDSNFFQWLEGPAANVDRVMVSIRHDPRHTDVEVLTEQAAGSRTFGRWAMQLATSDPASKPARLDVLEPPRELVEHLRKRPAAAPALLATLLPALTLESSGDSSTSTNAAHIPLRGKMASILRTVMLSSVIPELAGRHSMPLDPSCSQFLHPRAAELADLLIATDQGAAVELIRELRLGGALQPLYATLLEPAARRLGDLWSDDDCTEFDVTLGLCRLQAAVRLLNGGAAQAFPVGLTQPAVLIAPEPGELHQLGAALDSDVLSRAGWQPHSEYPSNDNALQDLLSGEWFDVLDLSLSTAFRRDHRLDHLSQTIAGARRASKNPDLMVVVGGRMFVEELRAGSKVGADLASRSAVDVEQGILGHLRDVDADHRGPAPARLS